MIKVYYPRCNSLPVLKKFEFGRLLLEKLALQGEAELITNMLTPEGKSQALEADRKVQISDDFFCEITNLSKPSMRGFSCSLS